MDTFHAVYIVEILNSFDPELQLEDTESAIKSKLIELFTQLRGLKFVKTLVLVFKKIEIKDKTKYDNFHLSSKAETIINESDIVNVFQSIYNYRKYTKIFIKRFRVDYWFSHLSYYYNPLAGSSYIKLPKELDHPRKELINIQNADDNECFTCCLVRYLNPADHNPARI